MRAGIRRHRIAIEQPSVVRSGTGAPSTSWTIFATLWASIETLKLYERQALAATFPAADSKISFKYIPGVLPTMRVNFNNKIYSILGINNIDERNRDIELTCQSGVKAA